jgi:hypothetical protein
MIIIPDLILILTLIVYLVLVRIKKVRFRLTVLALWLGTALLVDTVIAYRKIDLGAFLIFAGYALNLLAGFLFRYSQR